MSAPLAFEAVIEAAGRGGAWVHVPFDVKETLGSGRPKVRVTFDGHEYRGSVAKMGSGHCIGVRKDVRAAIGKDVGDTVRVTVERDTLPRVVEVPPELGAALDGARPEKARFDALSYTHRKEFARWVAEAKRPETRVRRAAKALVMLREGKRL